MIKDTYEKNKKEIDIVSVGLVTKTKERIKNLDRYLPTSLLRIKTQVRPQNWQLPNDVYAWQGLLVSSPAFRDVIWNFPDTNSTLHR